MSTSTDIRTLDDAALKAALIDLGQPAFRSKQVAEWIWTKGAARFDDMTNLPRGLRDLLAQAYTLAPIAPEEEQVSRDGTVKCAFPIEPGKVVEGVLIPAKDRMTACISSQVGCSLSCAFCATGKLKLLRNLTAGEIVDQVRHIAMLAERHHEHRLTNIVYMGMGEPLLILAFVVIIIGGIGSIRGAFIAAVIVGLVDTLGRVFLPMLLRSLVAESTADTVGPALASMLIYILMAGILVFRPRGLFPARTG